LDKSSWGPETRKKKTPNIIVFFELMVLKPTIKSRPIVKVFQKRAPLSPQPPRKMPCDEVSLLL